MRAEEILRMRHLTLFKLSPFAFKAGKALLWSLLGVDVRRYGLSNTAFIYRSVTGIPNSSGHAKDTVDLRYARVNLPSIVFFRSRSAPWLDHWKISAQLLTLYFVYCSQRQSATLHQNCGVVPLFGHRHLLNRPSQVWLDPGYLCSLNSLIHCYALFAPIFFQRPDNREFGVNLKQRVEWDRSSGKAVICLLGIMVWVWDLCF